MKINLSNSHSADGVSGAGAGHVHAAPLGSVPLVGSGVVPPRAYKEHH
jgi:hypothetical protein